MPRNKNTLSGAQAMVRMLEAYGVEHIFGLCGDTSLPFYDALNTLKPKIAHILARDERSAGYMADAYARVTGKVGVCEGPSGGGATYIAPGLAEANESSIPVLAITTDVATTAHGHYPLTELDQPALFAPLTKFNASIDAPEQLPTLVRAAFRAMTTGKPGAAHLAFPTNVQAAPVEPDDIWAQTEHGNFPAWRTAPDQDAARAMARALAGAKRPVLICGGGPVISGAQGELDRLAKRLDLVVATTISGKGCLSENHPNCLGVVGSNGGAPETSALVEEADLVMFVGCRAGAVTTDKWRVPTKNTPVLHLDVDPMVISATYATQAAMVADAQLGLAAINAELDNMEYSRRDGAVRIAPAIAAKQARFDKLSTSDAIPIRPERVVKTVAGLLDADAIVVADPGTPCPYFSAHYPVAKAGRTFITNRAHGALGFSMAASIGAHIGRPAVKTVAIMGDGSFGFTVGELETAARLGLPITFIVLSNASFGWIKAGQKSSFGARYFSVDFSPTDHAAIAAAYGLKSWRVVNPDDLKPALAAAFAAGKPTLVDIVVQPLQEAAAPVSEWIA